MKRLIYLKNGQSLDLLVSPLKLSMSLMVSKQRKKRNIKMIFFLTLSLIESSFLVIFFFSLFSSLCLVKLDHSKRYFCITQRQDFECFFSTKIIRAITSFFIFFFTKKEHISDITWLQSLKYISRGSQMFLKSGMKGAW
jgi:hypothetical protein